MLAHGPFLQRVIIRPSAVFLFIRNLIFFDTVPVRALNKFQIVVIRDSGDTGLLQ